MKVHIRQLEAERSAENLKSRCEGTHESLKWHSVQDEERTRYAKLVALGDRPTADEIESIKIGFDDKFYCDECEKIVDVAVRYEPDWDSCTPMICLDCLREAVKLAEETLKKETR